MTEEVLKLKLNAEYYRNLYRLGKCSREEAKDEILKIQKSFKKS